MENYYLYINGLRFILMTDDKWYKVHYCKKNFFPLCIILLLLYITLSNDICHVVL